VADRFSGGGPAGARLWSLSPGAHVGQPWPPGPCHTATVAGAASTPAGDRHPADQERQAAEGPGRPLDPTRAEAIIEATLAGLADVGYDRLTMDMVAARAKVGKATLYRRWSSKADLVIDALSAHKSDWKAPDTGTLRRDFEALLKGEGAPVDPDLAPLVCGLMTAASHDPTLSAALQDRFIDPRKKVISEIISRAVDRGEVDPGIDVDMVIQVVPAIMFVRAVLYGETVGPELFEQVLTQLVYPLLNAPRSAQWQPAGATEAVAQG
jgi:AcrR family transcriptional regulator